MIFENSLPKANFGQNIRDSPNGSLTADSRSLQTATLNFLSFNVFSLNPSFRKFSRTGDYLFKFIWTKEHLLQKNWPGTTCLLFHVKEHLCGWCEFANINLYLMAYSFFMFFFIWILIGHWRVTILMPHFFLQTTATGGVLHFSNFLILTGCQGAFANPPTYENLINWSPTLKVDFSFLFYHVCVGLSTKLYF